MSNGIDYNKLSEDTNGFDWKVIKATLEAAPWVYDRFDGVWLRRTWLGTTLGITPSGKVYAPWTTNQTDEDVAKDSAWQEAMEKAADLIDAHFFWDEDSGYVGQSKMELEDGDRFEIHLPKVLHPKCGVLSEHASNIEEDLYTHDDVAALVEEVKNYKPY